LLFKVKTDSPQTNSFSLELNQLKRSPKINFKIIRPIMPVLLAFLLKLGRYFKICPLSRPLIFLGCKYSYRAIELSSLEIGHLAAVVVSWVAHACL